MPAIAAEIFVVVPATFREAKKMSGEETYRRMFHLPSLGFGLQERMPTIAGVFMKIATGSNRMNAMAEQIAQVANLLHEDGPCRIRIAIDPEQQGMSATYTHILVVAGSYGDSDITMPGKKTRYRVRHACLLAVAEIRDSAIALLGRAAQKTEDRIADLMAE